MLKTGEIKLFCNSKQGMYSYYKKAISISIAIAVQAMVCAQINMSLKVTGNNIRHIDDLWDISVNSTFANAQIADIQLTVYNEDEETYYFGVCKSVVLQNNQTLNISSYKSSVEHIIINFPDNEEIKENKIDEHLIPAGSYIVCASIFTHEPRIEIGRSCESIQVTNSYLDSLIAIQQNKFTIQKLEPHIQVQAFSYFDIGNSNSEYSVQHRNSGFYISSQVKVAGFPVNFSFFYDTDSDFYYNSASTFQFNFDTYAYKEILAERLKETVEGNSEIPFDIYTQASNMMQDYESIESMMQHPMFQNELKFLDSIKVLENYLSDSAALEYANTQIEKYTDTAFIDQLYDSLNCDSNAVQQKIQANTDSLNQIRENLTQKIEAVGTLVEKAKGYKDILDRKDEISQLLLKDTMLANAVDQYEKLKDIDYNQFTDPTYLKDQLTNLDQLSTLESALSGLKTFQLGMTTPDYSEFSITGVLLNGVHINYETKKINLIGVAGKINDNSSLFSFDKYKQTYSKLYMAGAEYKINKTAKYGIYILQSDFENTDTLQWFNFLETNNAIANTFKDSLLKGKVFLEAEFAISYAQNKDFNYISDESPETTSDSKPFWPYLAILQKDDLENGMFTDNAGKLQLSTQINDGKTSLTIGSRYVGPGFYTPGNPFIINDLLSIIGSIEQTLFKNYVNVSIGIERNRDNLTGLKETTTAYSNYIGRLMLHFPKLPQITIDYRPNVIINEFEQIQVNALTATATYTYRLFNKPSIINASFVDVSTLSQIEQSSNFYNRVYNVMQTYLLNKVNIQAGWNLNYVQSVEDTIYYQTYSTGAQWNIKDKVDVSLMLQGIKEKADESISPGYQIEVAGQIFKSLSIRAGYYKLPALDIYFITDNENFGNQTAYITTTYTF